MLDSLNGTDDFMMLSRSFAILRTKKGWVDRFPLLMRKHVENDRSRTDLDTKGHDTLLALLSILYPKVLIVTLKQ